MVQYSHLNPEALISVLNKTEAAGSILNPVTINIFIKLLEGDKLKDFITLKSLDDTRWREIAKTLLDSWIDPQCLDQGHLNISEMNNLLSINSALKNLVNIETQHDH